MEKNCNCLDDRVTPSGCGPYFDNYVQQKYNYLNDRATSSGRDPNMESRGACY
jgi:hypothetical protein